LRKEGESRGVEKLKVAAVVAAMLAVGAGMELVVGKAMEGGAPEARADPPKKTPPASSGR